MPRTTVDFNGLNIGSKHQNECSKGQESDCPSLTHDDFEVRRSEQV